MILIAKDLIEEEKKGNLIIKNRGDYGPYSLDVSVEKLYRRKNEYDSRELEMSQAEWMNFALEGIEFGNIKKGKLYYAQLKESMYLGEGLIGEITTRSGWARKGLAIRTDSDAYLGKNKSFAVNPLCLLYSSIDVELKKYDKVGQLVISDNHSWVMEEEMMKLYNSKKLIVENAKIKHGGIFLTMNKKIYLYDNGFQEKNIEKGIVLEKDQFFLSASQQHIEIPEGYCGYVVEGLPKIGQTRFYIPFVTHANAPYIHPKNIFKGNIVFENTMINHGVIKEGMLQSQLVLKKLSGNCSGKSRYDNQNGTTKSKM